ncbi:MAG: ABC transporter substrate-binding protein, partial [Cetobacterium sp.]
MKKILGGLLIMGSLIGCGQKDETKVLTFSTWEGTGEQFFTDINDINTEYKKINPNVTIKIEKIPNTEYDTTMKIRNTAKQLPDIFAIRNKHMYSYRDAVHDLSDLNASKINTFAEPYKIDGKVVGLPMYGFNEYVYYRKSVFNKLGLEVPQTWNEFLGVVETINNSSDLIP